jgi:hypothetical protein
MNYHILDAVELEDAVRAVFHIPVPSATNAAGVDWQTALREFIPFASGDSAVPNLATTDSAEDDELVAGALHEVVARVNFSANATNNEKIAVVEAKFNELASSELTKLQARLKFWGYKGDVA